MIPTKNPLASLEDTSRDTKRAQYEAFEFTLVPDGIRVRSGSYADPENHEYLVTVTDCVPTDCTCPADAHCEGACKHRVAGAIRRPLINAVMVDTALAADGGLVDESRREDAAADPDGIAASAAGESDCPDCLAGVPCWECVRPGRRGLSGVE